MLPLQLIFQGKTTRVVPKGQATLRLKANGHHLTSSINHWSNVLTCQEFVVKVLRVWWEQKREEMKLPLTVKMVWLIDCWSVHISKAFRDWCKQEHEDWLCVVYVPANCTSKLQPADVILQRPLKGAFRAGFNTWLIGVAQSQFEKGVTPSNVQLDFTIGLLREQSCV
jgi:hypothetical protein